MKVDENLKNVLINSINSNITNLAGAKLGQAFYYSSLPICVIDSVFSIRTRYAAVGNVVRNWEIFSGWHIYRKPGLEEKTVAEFLAALDGKNAEELATQVFLNKQRTSPRGGILKSEAVVRFCEALEKSGIQKFSDFDPQKVEAARARVTGIPGQRSGITFSYFLMLAGDDSEVKPDTHIRRFVAKALGREFRDLHAEDAAALVREAAICLQENFENLTPRVLDHEIWKWQKSELARKRQR